MLVDFIDGKHLHAVVEQTAAFYKMIDDLVLPQFVRPRRHVVPHDELAEGELPDLRDVENLPSVHDFDGFAEFVQNGGDIDARFVRRQRIQPVDCHSEHLLQKLQQRDVDDGLFVRFRDEDAFAQRFADHAQRHENQRRDIELALVGGIAPFEIADGQIQRVDAAILHVRMGLAVDFQLSFLKFLVCRKRIQLLGIQLLIISFQHLVRRGVRIDRQFGIRLFADRRFQRLHFQRIIARQRVLQFRDVFANQRDDELVVAHVEQTVPQR